MAIIHGDFGFDFGPGDTVILRNPITVLSLGNTIELEPGSSTDLSSVPWYARWIYYWQDVAIAGAVHDQLFRTGEISWWEANEVWLDVATSSSPKGRGISKFKGVLGFIGLTLGSWVPWLRYRLND